MEYLKTQNGNFLVKGYPENQIAYFDSNKNFLKWSTEKEWDWAEETWNQIVYCDYFEFPIRKDFSVYHEFKTKAKLIGEIAKLTNCKFSLETINEAVSKCFDNDFINIEVTSDPESFAYITTTGLYLYGNEYEGRKEREETCLIYKSSEDFTPAIKEDVCWGNYKGEAENSTKKEVASFDINQKYLVVLETTKMQPGDDDVTIKVVAYIPDTENKVFEEYDELFKFFEKLK